MEASGGPSPPLSKSSLTAPFGETTTPVRPLFFVMPQRRSTRTDRQM